MDARHFSLVVVAIVVLVSSGMIPLTGKARAKDIALVVEANDIFFLPNVLRADPGDNITILVFNNGSIGHTFDITEFEVHLGTPTSPIPPSESRMTTITDVPAGVYWYFCAFPGHATRQGTGWQGMAGQLFVGQEPPTVNPTPFVIGGVVVAAVAIGVGVFAWSRRRSSGP